MTFLYPSFLWALTALSIPVIIHLFNFRRTTRVFFSNTRFLKQVKEVTTAKRRLKHYLILASRLLFLLFLVFAFAQPVIPAREQLGADRAITIYVDNSQSMSAQLADRTRGIESATAFARNLIDLFPPDTRYKILTNDFAPFSNTYKTKPEAIDILAQVRLSPVSRTIQEVRERINQDNRRNKDVFWISDFQKSTAGVISEWDSVQQWHLVPIKYSALSNVFVDTAYLENPFAARGEKNVLNVKMRNDGTKEVDQLNIKLSINDIQAGTALVNIPAKGTATTTFDLTSGLSGRNRGYLSFADFPVTFDNEFFVALNFTDKINIIEVKAQNEITPIERVFANREIFNFRSFSVNNFNYSLLNEAELVVIHGINKLEPSFARSMQTYLTQNLGAVLFIPGSSPDITSYQQLTGPRLQVRENEPLLSELNRPDFDHPFFENVFEERSSSLSMPKGTKLIDWGSDREAILQFKNGQPFLSRLNQGGKLFLLSNPLQRNYTDFFNHALFVPVMYRIAASAQRNENRLYYTSRESFIRVRLDSLVGDEPVKMQGVQEVVPSQRKLNNDVLLDIPRFSISQGFYNVTSGLDTLNLIAFNIDKAESLMDQFTGNEVKNQMGNGNNITIFEAGSVESFKSEIEARYLGKPLWKYALILALLFLLAEVLLVRFLK
jgi:hypothetical protein